MHRKRLKATTDFSRLREMDAILICVPTPLDAHREPDLSFVRDTAESITPHLRRGQLVVLESTTYPGTTEEVVLPILEKSGLHCPVMPYATDGQEVTPGDVAATGTINYQNILVTAHFDEDKWVVAAEMRAGNPKVVHHMRAIVRPPGATWMAKAVPGEAYEEGSEGMGGAKEGTDLLGKYNPGLGAQRFDVDGSAKFIPKGSDIVFNIHYTAVGTPQTDKSKVGLVFAKNPPLKRYWMSPGTPAAFNLAIPAGDSNAEVISEVTVGVDDAKLVYIQPHMHLRGKDYELRLIYPTGETQTVFKGKWNFDWQIGYQLEKPLPLPKGTRLLAIAHYDNSANNKYNPDPSKDIRWGDQNWDEMQSGFIGLVLDVNTDVNKIFKSSGPSLLPRGTFGPSLATLTGGR